MAQEISNTKGVKEGLNKEEEEKEPTSGYRRLPSNPARTSSASSAFVFWVYLALLVSIIAILSSLLHLSLRSATTSAVGDQNRRSWFQSLPDDLRRHYSSGKLIKTFAPSGAAAREVFAVDFGPREGDVVLLLHGLGCSSFSFRRVLPSLAAAGLRAVAVDLPGSGFSDRLGENSGRWGGILVGFYDVYTEIKEKGIFWGFDRLVETGGIPYEEIRAGRPESEGIGTVSHYEPAEVAKVLGQVIDSMGLSPVHLVLHDSALALGMNLAALNPETVRSFTLIDPAAHLPAFPWGILGAPVIGPLLLQSRFAFTKLLQMCCSRSMDESVAEAYRLLLRGNNGRKAVIEAGNAMNHSFDLGEWLRSVVGDDLQVQVLWSNMWSDRWINEGKEAVAKIPSAKFAYHSGGRWPQEDAADEISNVIVQFLMSFPKLAKEIKEEPHVKHIEEKILEGSGDRYGHYHNPYGHDHEQLADYAGIYGHAHHPYDHDHEPVAGYAGMYGFGEG